MRYNKKILSCSFYRRRRRREANVLLNTYFVPSIFTSSVFLSAKQSEALGNQYPHFTTKETEVQRNNTPTLLLRKLRLRGVRSNAQDLTSKCEALAGSGATKAAECLLGCAARGVDHLERRSSPAQSCRKCGSRSVSRPVVQRPLCGAASIAPNVVPRASGPLDCSRDGDPKPREPLCSPSGN